MKKYIGDLFGTKIILEGDKIEAAMNSLGENKYIYFNDYKDGHHPKFFEKYPNLKYLLDKK